MFTSRRSLRPVVVSCLGLFFVLGVRDTCLAAAPQAVGAEDQSPTPAAAVAASGAEGGADLKLRVAFFNAVGMPADIETDMRRGVDAIFRRMGVAIEWHEPKSFVDGAGEEQESYYLKVVLCRYEPSALGHAPDAMGITLGTHFPHDAVWLFNPVIERALVDRSRRPRPVSGPEQARAYARVFAHEVVHAIANDQRHAGRGLMTGSLNRHLLVGMEIEIDDETTAALQQGIMRISAMAAR